MNPIIMTCLLIAGLGLFVFSMWRRIRLLASLKRTPETRLDAIGQRIWAVIEFAFAQLRLLKRDTYVGMMHAFIFWGFLAVGIRSLELFGQGFAADFHLPFLTGIVRDIYYYSLIVFEVLVTVAVAILLQRRLIAKPPRLTLSIEANLILAAIAILMITDFIMEGSNNTTAYRVSYWIHTAGILAFLNWLPYSKHFHIITAIPNVFLRRLTPPGALSKIDLEDESATSFGTQKISELDWKQALDLMTCTECGRCQDVCPAHAAEKPLSPKELSINLRDHLYGNAKQCVNKRETPELVPDTVKSETLWSCTTCGACEEACPIFIEYVDRMVDMRRNLVLMKGEMPAELATTMKNLETNGNPWGFGAHARGDWARGLNAPLIKDKTDAEYLLFVGCAGAYDDRAKKVSKAVVKILNAAGISFAILGDEETCTGDSARRAGNEYLFQMLAGQNIETFDRYGIKKIIATCPHCYNTLKNEYPQFGGNYEVVHHVELISELLESGWPAGHLSRSPSHQHNQITHRMSGLAVKDPPPLPDSSDSPHTITYHDSCYLGRYNKLYDAPRSILKKMGADLVEPENSRDNGRCCGAGGGLMWLEDKQGKRMNHIRAKELIDSTGAKTIATSCPFCLTMLSDACKDLGLAETEVKDIAEVLAESL